MGLEGVVESVDNVTVLSDSSEEDGDDKDDLFEATHRNTLVLRGLTAKGRSLSVINWEWNSIYAQESCRRTSIKIRFASKVKRIWILEVPDGDESGLEIEVDEVDLKRNGEQDQQDAPLFGQNLNPTLKNGMGESDLAEDATTVLLGPGPPRANDTTGTKLEFNVGDQPTQPFQLQDPKFRQEGQGGGDVQMAVSPDVTENERTTVRAFFTVEFLAKLKNLPELQYLIMKQLKEAALPQGLVKEIFSEGFTKLIYVQEKPVERWGVQAEPKVCLDSVLSPLLELVPTNSDEKENVDGSDPTPRERTDSSKEKESISSQKNHRQHTVSGSSDKSPYYSGKKHKAKVPSQLPRRFSPRNLTQTPVAESKKPKPAERQSSSTEESQQKDSRLPMMIDTDWLRHKIERNDPVVMPSLQPFTTPTSSKVATDTTPAVKKKLMYNSAGRHFYTSDEQLGSGRRTSHISSNSAQTDKSESTTPKVKRGGQPKLNRHTSPISPN